MNMTVFCFITGSDLFVNMATAYKNVMSAEFLLSSQMLFIVFITMTVAVFIALIPLVARTVKKGKARTNAELLIGRQAICLEQIDNLKSTGVVTIDGLEWMARSANSMVIEPGAVVRICGIEGVKLIVLKLDLHQAGNWAQHIMNKPNQ